ncbi:hypothetical protein C1H46_040484 [Malus baccata]|uniref:PLAC8 family protein n=1 Tax=Malus baccata TaxID=106549 RepID=A0A540KIC8_MALBA|nr:hypothetical protein C1H46_040484 [Malus baccata]
MGDLEKQETVLLKKAADEAEGEEKERLLEGNGMAVVDFDLLCSTVALQTQGKLAAKLQSFPDVEEGGDAGDLGGVFRMWEGEVLDCFDDRRVALESLCCPCYRFGKNMRRAGFGPCSLQGALHLILVVLVLLNCIAFIVTKKHCFLYLAVAFTISLGTYLGYFRTQIKKKFNIREENYIRCRKYRKCGLGTVNGLLFPSRGEDAVTAMFSIIAIGGDSSLDDCIYHLICPCCALCQESRTLEMNNVQDGTWHGRGDTIYIGSLGEGAKSFFELQPPPIVSIKSPDPCSL